MNGQSGHSAGSEHFAFDYDSGNSDAIENIFRQRDSVRFAEHEINLRIFIGNENQRASGRGAKLGAECVIVSVNVTAEIAVGVCDFATHADRVAGLDLSDQQVDVSLLG